MTQKKETKSEAKQTTMNARHNFLFMADAHIKTRTWTNFPKVMGDSYAALEYISGKLGDMRQDFPEECPDTLVIGGDWFDSNRPSALDYQETQRFLKQFRQVYFIRGNHDSAEPAWLGSMENAMELDPERGFLRVFDDADVWIAGISWQSSADKLKEHLQKLSEQARDIAGKKYVVLHAPFKELLGYEGAYQLSFGDLSMFEGTAVTFLVGDVHTRRTCSIGFDLLFHSPGPIYALSTDALGDIYRHVTLVSPSMQPTTNCSLSADGAFLNQEVYTGIEDIEIIGRNTSKELFESMEASLPHWKTLSTVKRERFHGDEYSERWAQFMLPFVLLFVPQELAGSFRPGEVPGGIIIQPRIIGKDADAASAESAPTDTLEDAVRGELSFDSDLADMGASLLNDDDPVGSASGWLDQWGVVRTDS